MRPRRVIKRWATTIPSSGPVFDAGSVVLVGGVNYPDPGWLRGVDVGTGKVLWHQETERPAIRFIEIADTLIAITSDPSVFCE